MIGWFLAGKAGDLIADVRDLINNLRRFLTLVVIAPLLVIGIGLWLGYSADLDNNSVNADAAAVTVSIGAFLGLALVTILWVRVTAILYGTWLGSKGLQGVTDKLPALEKKDAAEVSSWLRTSCAWIDGGFLLTLLLNHQSPLWRNLFLFIILVACGFFLMMSNEWFKRKIGRVVAFTAVVGIFGISTLSYISPSFKGQLDYYSRWLLGNSEYATLADAARQEAVEIGKPTMARLLKEQNAIRRCSLQKGHGSFCPGDEAKFQANQQLISEIEKGTYLERKASVVETPAPEAAPANAAAKSPDQPAKTGLRQRFAARTNELKEIFDQFPDL